MAGYGIRAFLIAQSLNQIVKAYGENNSILDNCHVRIAFSTNDERTARRISDALGTATEQRAMRNYAGHRLSPWLGHVMVSRQETSRPLLTPGEVMQLPPAEELVLMSGLAPVRARKIRYFRDRNFRARVSAAPILGAGGYADVPAARGHDWAGIASPVITGPVAAGCSISPADEGGLQHARQPAIARRRRARPLPEQLDLLGLGEDEGAPVPLAPLSAAHAANQGSARGDELLPSF
jgi:type IV secretion system protein VirD4